MLRVKRSSKKFESSDKIEGVENAWEKVKKTWIKTEIYYYNNGTKLN